MTLYQSVISGRLLLTSLLACYAAMNWDTEMYQFMLMARLEHCARVEKLPIAKVAKRVYYNISSLQCKLGKQPFLTEKDHYLEATCEVTSPVVTKLMRTR